MYRLARHKYTTNFYPQIFEALLHEHKEDLSLFMQDRSKALELLKWTGAEPSAGGQRFCQERELSKCTYISNKLT